MMNLDIKDNSSYAVLGLGETGRATAECLVHHDCRVMVWDDQKEKMDDFDKKMHLPSFDTCDFSQIDGLIVSPGIALEGDVLHPMVRLAHHHGCSVMRDLALFNHNLSPARRIAVTGTDGKSTVVALLAAIFDEAAISHAVGGNSFCGFLSLSSLEQGGFYLLEVSSYQLEGDGKIELDAAVLLNVSQDHLQRHGSMENYAAIKERIFASIKEESSLCVIGSSDAYCDAIAHRLQGRGINPMRLRQDKQSIDHHQLNKETCMEVARWVGIDDEIAIRAMDNFKSLPHRIESILSFKGRLFVNDSKATNPHAAAAAVASFNHIFWICGGLHKGVSFEPLSPHLIHVRKAYVVGTKQEPLIQFLEDAAIAYRQCDSQEDAIEQAFVDSEATCNRQQSVTILLSPAAASQDRWQDFSQRGDAFRHYVEQRFGAES